MTETMIRLLRGLLLPLLVGFRMMPLAAQDRLDPEAMGKARASVASVRGLGALVANPGGLHLRPIESGTARSNLQLDRLLFSVYNFGGTIGSTYFSSSDFEQIFGRSVGWPEQDDRRRLAELLQDERLFANGANNLVEARYRTDAGTFGLYYGQRIYVRLNFPDEFKRVLETGELLAEQYRFINRGIGGSWISELGLSYGTAFGDGGADPWFRQIGLGATVKLLQGIAQFGVDDNSLITVDQKTIGGTRSYVIQGGYAIRSSQPGEFDPADAVSQFELGLFPSTAGIGFGADIGVSGVLYTRMRRGADAVVTAHDAIFFGMAVQNLGRITWDGDNYLRVESGINDTLRNAALDNERFQQYQGTLQRTAEYSTALPAVFRAGLAMNVNAFTDDMSTPLVLDIEGEVPLNSVPGNTVDPRLAIGADWGVSDDFALRGGFSAGGISGFGIGLGIGWQPTDWLSVDIGSGELNGIISGERVDLAIRLTAGLR